LDYNEFTAGDLITHGTFLYYTGPDKTVWITREGDRMYTTTEWHVDALIEANKAAANSFSRSGGLGDMVRVASIPVGLLNKWSDEGIVDDPTAFARRLNDSDFSKFRTNNLKV
jgi:hypothetical protein